MAFFFDLLLSCRGAAEKSVQLEFAGHATDITFSLHLALLRKPGGMQANSRSETVRAANAIWRLLHQSVDQKI
jgi:hypothetical protein